MQSYRGLFIAIAIVILAGTALAYFQYGSSARAERNATQTITEFGAHLKDVSLLGPEASTTIAAEYGPYVEPALLAKWQADPRSAPGRTTSSPWPERIEVLDMTPQGKGFAAQAAVILMTSEEAGTEGNAGFIPVMILAMPGEGGWRIAAFEEQNIMQGVPGEAAGN